MKKELGSQKLLRLSLNECLVIAVIALFLVVALFEKKEVSSSINQKKEVNVIEVPVKVTPLTQEVISEDSQFSSDVAERLGAAGFSTTQLVKITMTDKQGEVK